MSDGARSFELICGEARARVDALGGELRRWRIGERDLLWSPQAAIWPAVSPILFPIVGRLRGDEARVRGRTMPMGVHGFAARKTFAIEQIDESCARCVLHDGRQTRMDYPFGFRLEVEYRLTAASLAIGLCVENTGDCDMPYACGLHPGFRWPFDDGAREDYRIVFEQNEGPDVPEITSEGLFTRGRWRTPIEDRILPLSSDLFSREALCFLNASSRSVLFVSNSGAAILAETEDFPHWALWSRPRAPFLCVESWTGHGDPADFVGDVFDKPSMRVLEPGARGRHRALYTFLSEGGRFPSDGRSGKSLPSRAWIQR
ncbi:MAG TPA: aldose 1-epimerase family protein [Beijerinckiaceae bacterium]|nr:aldose 1-epimerase family protein [Beijerinckiaceae bacterium]